MKRFFLISAVFALILVPAGEASAAAFFQDISTPESLRKAYADANAGGEKLKILIVPGHDDVASGTWYGGLREADINLALSKKLASYLSGIPSFEVTLTRPDAWYSKELDSYFTNNRESILAYRANQTAEMARHLTSGAIRPYALVDHNAAPLETAIRLWGINTWANENGYDLIVHVHFNDVPRANRSKPGSYSGVAMYVPESQFSNAKGSRAVAEAVRARLAAFYPTSNLPGENGGITEDQWLVAIGSNNSLNASSVLIEYDYVYEPIVQNALVRDIAFDDMAFQTYLGIRDFFEPGSVKKGETRYLPRSWDKNLSRGASGLDVLSLQAALLTEGFYPPKGRSRNDCPLSGTFGSCTAQAVSAYRAARGLQPALTVDAAMRELLNARYIASR